MCGGLLWSVLLASSVVLLADATYVPHAGTPAPLRLVWCAPFLSGGGLCDEATSFARALRGRRGGFSIVPHGDSVNDNYLASLDDTTASVAAVTWRQMPDVGSAIDT